VNAKLTILDGNLLDQPVEAIVNAWNRNIIPWWLLLPQGVSGAIKKQGGYQPFRELARCGPLKAGGACATSAGRLPFKAIIHVAGLNLLWRSSAGIVSDCVTNALALAGERHFGSLAFPLIGAGTGGLDRELVVRIMSEAAERSAYEGEIRIVRFKREG
jgi:O-acetyl-ADP-ribose deacetylase (regulator of RNase III)